MHRGKIAAGPVETYDWVALPSFEAASKIALTNPAASLGAKCRTVGCADQYLPTEPYSLASKLLTFCLRAKSREARTPRNSLILIPEMVPAHRIELWTY